MDSITITSPWATDVRLYDRNHRLHLWEEGKNDGAYFVTQGWRTVAIIPVNVGNGMDVEEQRAEQNARLIAAAPSLLTACRAIVEMLNVDEDGNHRVDWEQSEDALAACKAALGEVEEPW